MRIKVAIVDDDPSICRALFRLLGQLNMDAETFSSGHEFIESLERSKPDWLVLDLRMPQMGGWEVLSKLRQMKTEIRTIIVSADDELGAGPFEASGATAVLAKPFDQSSLLGAIAQMSSVGRLSEQKPAR